MDKPKKTGHELAVELLMSVILAKVAGDGEIELINEFLVPKIHQTLEFGGLDKEDQQLVAARAIQALDDICSLASVFHPHLRPD